MIRRLAATPVFVQVAALVLASILAAQLIGFAIVVYAPPPAPGALSISAVLDFIASGAEENADLTRSVEADAPFEAKPGSSTSPHTLIARTIADALGIEKKMVRVEMIDSYGWGAPGTSPSSTQGGVAILPGPAPGSLPAQSGDARQKLGDLLRAQHVTFPPFKTAILREGAGWMVVTPRAGGLGAWQSRILLWFLFAAAALAPFVWIMAGMLTRPIREFARGVEHFGSDPTAAPLEERGPREVRRAIQSFNRMQASLKAYVNERSAMVAAIAHDLRTPLTSLRFRAEAAPDAARDRMVEDIERMNAMASQVMAFVRGEQKREPLERLDLGHMAEQCVQDLLERGADVSCTADAQIEVMGEPLNLRRALTNLIENAVKFAGSAHVSVHSHDDQAIFQVDDDGPGLAEDELEKAFEPFHRAEPSRSRQTGGMGLGLALVRTVIQAHGGDVSLRNRQPSGLSARVSLRLAPVQDGSSAGV